MIPVLVHAAAGGEALGRCEVDENGDSPQIAEGNTEWEVVVLDRVPDRSTEKVIDGSIVSKSAGEIANEKHQNSVNAILSSGRLPPTDGLRLTHAALYRLGISTGEIADDKSFDEYLEALAGEL